MSAPSQSERVYVEFIAGKFGKQIPIVDSFMFYPKDRERVRFVCKTVGCNASITLHVDGQGKVFTPDKPKHNHPNHAYAIANLVHMQRIRADIKDRLNKYVPTRAVVSTIHRETKTSRRRSTDLRLARRTRMNGPQPRIAADIVLTPTLVGNSIHISEDKNIIVLAREWSIQLLSRAERICIDGTFRSAPATHYQVLSFHVVCKNGSSFPIIHVLLNDKNILTLKCSV